MASQGQFPTLRLAPTIEPLLEVSSQLRDAIERLASMSFRHVQLSATHRGLRPRDLDATARRDLLALLGRWQLTVTGLDVWIPAHHFTDPATVDRAMDATKAAIRMAEDFGRVPVSMTLPAEIRPTSTSKEDDSLDTRSEGTSNVDSGCAATSIATTLAALAEHHGVPIADHSVPWKKRETIGLGIDPPAWLMKHEDPVQACMANPSDVASARLCDVSTTGQRMPIGDRQHAGFDWSAYGFSLAAVGYSRAVVIDARQWLNPWEGIAQTATAWLQIFGGSI